MSTATLPRALRLTWQEMNEEAARRFGPDAARFAWQCPSCGDVATLQEWRDATGDPEPAAGQECIGRVVEGRGCDRTAYGPIRGGIWIVDTSVSVFEFFPLAPAAVRGADL